MGLRLSAVSFLLLAILFVALKCADANAEVTETSVLERSMSETLDLWREGRFEQLYESLSHRGRTTKENFIARMRETTIRPACCWQKLQNFRVMHEKRTEATVYVRVNLEGTPGPVDSSTRDFKLSLEDGGWRMQLNDIFSLAGVTGKKGKSSSSRHKNNIITAPYQ